MTRLTRKTNGKDYCLYCDCIEKENEIFEKRQELLSPEEYYKEEPYTMNDEYYLEDAMNRLGKLEDIEEELDCPLEVVFKALKDGIEFEHNITHQKMISNSTKLFYFYNEWWIRSYIKIGNSGNAYDRFLKDYQKTWWLKG